MVLARERFGPRAVEYKTREELVRALFDGPTPAPQAPAPASRVVVTRDFFVPAKLP
jgi:hypothetical protein